MAGGKRAGAGRPVGTGKTGGIPTKVVRIPVIYADFLKDNSMEFFEDLRSLVEHYDELTHSQDYSSNPRKVLARRLLDDLKAILPEGV